MEIWEEVSTCRQWVWDLCKGAQRSSDTAFLPTRATGRIDDVRTCCSGLDPSHTSRRIRCVPICAASWAVYLDSLPFLFSIFYIPPCHTPKNQPSLGLHCCCFEVWARWCSLVVISWQLDHSLCFASLHRIVLVLVLCTDFLVVPEALVVMMGRIPD